jgi:hypothetical protein
MNYSHEGNNYWVSLLLMPRAVSLILPADSLGAVHLFHWKVLQLILFVYICITSVLYCHSDGAEAEERS